MKKFIMMIVRWIKSGKILSAPRVYIMAIFNHYYSNKGMALISIYNKRVPNDFDLIRKIRKEGKMGLSELEAYSIMMTVEKTEKIKGDIAEVGVYRGGSAKLICETTKKFVHLFDTFEGLPDLCESDDPNQLHKGDYSASIESVKSYLKNYSNICFYKGCFPLTAEPVRNKTFSFINLDVDLYESTLNCLKFFYPRVNKGGVIISHDYPSLEGVKRAIDEFFEDKPEMVIQLPACSQCLVVKG